jgi:hypothetical protein
MAAIVLRRKNVGPVFYPVQRTARYFFVIAVSLVISLVFS